MPGDDKHYDVLMDISQKLIRVETNSVNTTKRLDEFVNTITKLDDAVRSLPKLENDLKNITDILRENKDRIKNLEDKEREFDDRLDELEHMWENMNSTFFKPLSRIFWYIVFGVIGIGIVTAIIVGIQNIG